MKYFTYISIEYACKNKLEKAISDLLKTCDRKILSVAEMDFVKMQIREEIDKLNIAFPRCTPIHYAFCTIGNDIILHLGGGICSLNFYSTK